MFEGIKVLEDCFFHQFIAQRTFLLICTEIADYFRPHGLATYNSDWHLR